mmetsp:Transcript_20971/g.41115  ORF Transcript_20971/g.41115 Transcript_20971/m.41115 type:complete len:260 (+) Transcript_20971:164-943(+)|eukprot:CAMPEP_0171489296 /NCGR_PEP_ID=MMETSP0958-20121227/2679_1 /TAXON_ID=87120 /ORGANISM="Aurantiochytrium limacinum, Strain ATCCMYA-1381" /LENGTH=259 /DNA_ID=CAMNT_0012022495 /DNA_START=63 /DNA_END=842 /DNA_ORIENTATION=-
MTSLRSDGRSATELRPLSASCGVLKRAHGSCRLEAGGTAVLASVYGPVAEQQTRLELSERARIQVEVHWSQRSDELEEAAAAPNLDNESSALSSRRREAEDILVGILEQCVQVRAFPRKLIKITIQVVNDGGAVLSCAVVAASAALLDAGIEMIAVPSAASCAVQSSGSIILDPTREEESSGSTLAQVFLCTLDDVSGDAAALTTDGPLDKDTLQDAMDSCTRGARAARAFLRLSFTANAQQRIQTIPANAVEVPSTSS